MVATRMRSPIGDRVLPPRWVFRSWCIVHLGEARSLAVTDLSEMMNARTERGEEMSGADIEARASRKETIRGIHSDILAAQLRVVLDEVRGRQTPEALGDWHSERPRGRRDPSSR